MVTFCNKTNADGVSLHQFPADDNVRRQWIAFVRTKREPSIWTPGSSHICSEHFTGDEGFGAKLAGFTSKLVLKKTAVPSIQVTPTAEQVNTARRVKRKLPSSGEKANSKGTDSKDEQQWYTTPKRKSQALSKLTANRVRARCKIHLFFVYIPALHPLFTCILNTSHVNFHFGQLLTQFERINVEGKETAAQVIPHTRNLTRNLKRTYLETKILPGRFWTYGPKSVQRIKGRGS